jgi:hypothetical protein
VGCKAKSFKKARSGLKAPSSSSGSSKKTKSRGGMDKNNRNADDDGILVPGCNDDGILVPGCNDDGILVPGCNDDGILVPACNNDGDGLYYGIFRRNAPVVSHNNAFGRGRYDAVSDRSDNGYF